MFRVLVRVAVVTNNYMVKKLKNNKSGYQGESGFTLIELLVVIAVIALLLAISLPVLTKIRCLSKRVACQSNLRQIAVAWQAYFADNSDSFYQGINANVIFGGWKGIAFDPPVPRPLNKYFSLPQIVNSEMDAKIFRCPADNGGLNVTPLPIYHYLGNSYQTNILLIGQNQIGWLPSAELKKQINKRLENIAYSHVDSPGRVLLVGDYGWVNQSFPAVPKIKDWHSKPAHHNVAFLDGHVEFLNIRKGLYITEAYTVLPWKDLYSLASEVQEEE